jgi:hypothetical protein
MHAIVIYISNGIMIHMQLAGCDSDSRYIYEYIYSCRYDYYVYTSLYLCMFMIIVTHRLSILIAILDLYFYLSSCIVRRRRIPGGAGGAPSRTQAAPWHFPERNPLRSS